MSDFLTKIRANLVADKYSLVQKVDEGGFGAVYIAQDVYTKEKVALKLEHVDKEPFLREEYERYAGFNNFAGFPEIYWFGDYGDYRIMAMELLGPTLDDLLLYCGGQFTLKTTLMVADQLLERLGTIHAKGLLHRDIKPSNCMVGSGRSSSTIYLADLGLMKEYNAVGYGAQDNESDCLRLLGTADFASLRAHRSMYQSPRDDLESLGYMLIYFLRGKLPWAEAETVNEEEEANRRIFEMKREMDVPKLCAGLPQEFAQYMTTAKSAPKEQVTDYDDLRAVFRKAAQAASIEYDHIYDWTIRRYCEERQKTLGGNKTRTK